jgi:hypothetical protein
VLPHKKRNMRGNCSSRPSAALANTESTTHSPHEYNNPQIASRGLQLS